LAADKTKFSAQLPIANSWAYQALDLEKSKNLTENEKKRVDPKYQLDKPKDPMPKPEYFH